MFADFFSLRSKSLDLGWIQTGKVYRLMILSPNELNTFKVARQKYINQEKELMMWWELVLLFHRAAPPAPHSIELSPWCSVWLSLRTTSPWHPVSSSEPSRGRHSASHWWWSPSPASTATLWWYWTSSRSTPPSSSRTTTASPPASAPSTAWERKDTTGSHTYSI